MWKLLFCSPITRSDASGVDTIFASLRYATSDVNSPAHGLCNVAQGRGAVGGFLPRVFSGALILRRSASPRALLTFLPSSREKEIVVRSSHSAPSAVSARSRVRLSARALISRPDGPRDSACVYRPRDVPIVPRSDVFRLRVMNASPRRSRASGISIRGVTAPAPSRRAPPEPMRIQFSPSYARLAMNDSYYWPVSMEHVRAALPVYEDRSIRARDALLLPADFAPRSRGVGSGVSRTLLDSALSCDSEQQVRGILS